VNPIARLEQLRAARERVLNLTPTDKPDKADNLRPDNQDCRECRVCRQGVMSGAGLSDGATEAGLSGMSGLSAGCNVESPNANPQRWSVPPDAEIPLATITPTLRPDDAELVTIHLKRQSPDVWKWIEAQADRYTRRDTRQPRSAAELEAALDCLLWQWEVLASVPPPDRASRYDRIQSAVKLLRSLEETDRQFAEYLAEHSAERRKSKGERQP